MKKLWISIGMALGLLAAPAIATAQTASTADLNQYLYQTKAGTFTDLSTIQETDNLKKYTLGTDLSEGTSLQNSFFIANAAGDNFEHTSFAADLAEDDESRVKPAVALSTLGIQKLLFVKSEMKGIALSAIGGILFTDTETENKPTVNCQTKVERNSYLKQCLRAHMIDKDGEFINPTKGTNAPVVLVVGTDANKGQYLWVQFDYMVDGMNWVYQIRYYADGQADFIIKTLGEASTLTDKEYKFQPIFQQRNGDDTRLCITAGNDKESKTNNWNIIETTTFNKWWGLNVSPQSIPEEGRTISILPPLDPTAFSCDNDQVTIKPTAISGNIAFDPSKTTQAAFDATDKIILIVSEYTNASWITLDGSKTPAIGDKGTSYEVLYFGKPASFTASNLPFNATGLAQDKNYTIHAYSVMENELAKKPYTFTAGIASFTFKTSKIDPPTVAVGEITADGQAKLTFQPAAGHSTMLVKSNKVTAPAVAGKLQQGDGLGTNGADGVVIGVWDATTTAYDLPLQAGEGCYLHFYSVADAGTDDAVYSYAAVTTTIYRPAETLPISWSFNENQVTSYSSALPLLPPGWQHDASSTYNGYKYFSVANSNNPAIGCALSTYLSNQEIAVLTPTFIPASTGKLEAIFTGAYPSKIIEANDWIRIDFREDGGDWQQARKFENTELILDEQGLFSLSVALDATAGKKIEMRYTMNSAQESWAYHYFKSLEIITYNPCRKPTDVTIAADATTDQAVKLSWDAIAEATAFTVAYQEAGTETPDEWTEKPTTGKEMTLDGLNSRTAYRIKVSAACTIEGVDYTSPFTDAVTATTYAGAPYRERMDNVYEDPEDWLSDLLSTPADRGVKTYTGKIGGTLSENTGASYTWSSNNSVSAINRKPETAMGVKDDMDEGSVLLTPVIYVDREDLYLNVTLTSFSAAQNQETYFNEIVEKGNVAPNADCKLHIAVSNTGSFTEADIVKTLTGDELKLDETVVKIQLEKKGKLQIGLFFDNPTPNYREDPHFYLEVSDLKLIPDRKFTLTAAAAPAEGGSVSGGGEFYATDYVTLRAIANNGYDFVAWKHGETELSTSATYTFEMPGENVTYTAHFALHEYSLNLTASPAAGGTVEGAKKYTMGADVTVKATPAQGYVFVAWMNGETEVSKAAEYTFKMPASDLSYTAKFEKPQYELTLAPSSPRAGSVEGAGSYEADADVTIKATPNENYVFVAWMKGTDTISREAEYTFKMPAEKTHYMALFKINRTEYELTLTATPENAGTVTGGGSYEADADVTIKATANDGFVFVAWMNGNDTLSREAEYTFKMPAENTAYTALFAAEQVANEDVLRANFNLYAKDGRLHIRNLAGLTIASVDVYGLNGQRLNRFAPNSREDLSLAVAAERALVFVRIDTERGAVVYKIYLP